MAIIALNSASTGLSALSTALDVIANNLANTNTDGFKASRTNFEDLLYQERAQPGVENANGDQRPMGTYVGLGTRISGTQLDFSIGATRSTDSDLDVMIYGDGFFQVEVEDELVEGGIAYTRAGNFGLNRDGEIVLASSTGRRLIPSIVVPTGTSTISILEDGTVYAAVLGDTEPTEIGQFELTSFINPVGLKQLGENLFAESAASGVADTGQPGEGGRGILKQGFLEGSNVDPVKELVDLIRVQRAFEMNSQSIQAADEMLQTVGRLRSF